MKYVKERINKDLNEKMTLKDLEGKIAGPGYYSMYTVFGGTRKEIEPKLAELYYKNQDLFSYGFTSIDTPNDIFSFVSWKAFPCDATYLSCLLPEKLCVGIINWEYSFIHIYTNGKEAVPGKDYVMDLNYWNSEENNEIHTYNAEFFITDNNGISTRFFLEACTENEIEELKKISTKWHEKLTDFERD